MTSHAHRRRLYWVLLGLVAVAILLAVWLWPRPMAPAIPGTPGAAPSSAPGSPQVGAATLGPQAASGPEAQTEIPADPPLPGTTPEQPAAPPSDPPLPPTTQLLAEEFYPGTTDWEEVPTGDPSGTILRILPLRYNVVVPAPIAVLLEIIDKKGQRQPLKNPQVRVHPLDQPEAPWIDVPVRDDGKGADAKAGDLQYTATLQPDPAQRKVLLGRVLAEGSVEVPGVGTRVIPATLIYTLGPRARLTGRWRDYVQAGHLYLEAELEVEEAGLFTLMAQVFGPALEPIAWTKQTTTLNAGRGTLTLQVFGKALHDAGIDGPYRVRQVLLSRDYENSSDYDPGVTIEEAHHTQAYRAHDFSPAAYTPPPRPVAEEITAEHPSQQGKPPPLRTRTQTP
jgi:hypothetical protein